VNVYDIVDRLPPIEVLRDRCRALAVLEIIQDSEYAYYTYGAWGDDEAALMSNGSGDEYSIVFTDAGVFIRVFDHEVFTAVPFTGVTDVASQPVARRRQVDQSSSAPLLDGMRS
jgi:hypothetical protein